MTAMDAVEPPDPVQRVAILVERAGIAGRRIREIVGLLAEGPQTLASLIQQSGVDRRTVEQVLGALRDDLLENADGSVRVAPKRVDA